MITIEDFCRKRNILIIDDVTHTYTIDASIEDFKEYAKEVLLEFTKDKQKVNLESDWLIPNTSIFNFIKDLK